MSSFIIPRLVHHGLGSLEKLKEVRAKKAVIVTGGASMRKHGFLDRAIGILRSASISASVFEGVEADPSFATVTRGTAVLGDEQPDLVIGLGGCSAIDAAKIMWVFYEHPDAKPGDVIPPFSIKPLRNKASFVAIPSTSGTGTEVTCAAVITDREKGVKYPIVSYELTPDIAIVDGELCASMPPNVTANTGLDALSHAIEAFVAAGADSYTDMLASAAARAIFESLPVAYQTPSDLAARQAVHDASCWAGMAFTNAFLGIVHGLSHQLGATFGIPHGRANAILMPNVIRYNSSETGKYSGIAPVAGRRSAAELAVAVEELRRSVGIEDSLKAYGIPAARFDAKVELMAENALRDACTGANPRKPNLDEAKRLLRFCFEGEPVDF